MEKKVDENKLLDDEQLDAVTGGGSPLDPSLGPIFLYTCSACGAEMKLRGHQPHIRCKICGKLMFPGIIVHPTAE